MRVRNDVDSTPCRHRTDHPFLTGKKPSLAEFFLRHVDTYVAMHEKSLEKNDFSGTVFSALLRSYC